jgi:hypothetical protein
MVVNIDTENLKKAWFTYDEIQDIIESEEEFEKNWISYDLDEAFVMIKNDLFSKKENKVCLK